MESDKIIESILNDFNSFNIDDIPNIDLYMDQVTTYLNNKFEGSIKKFIKKQGADFRSLYASVAQLDRAQDSDS